MNKLKFFLVLTGLGMLANSACGVKGPPLPPVAGNPSDSDLPSVSATPSSAPTPDVSPSPRPKKKKH